MILSLMAGLEFTQAQKGGSIQILNGRIEPRGGFFYVLPDLKEGETLYVYLSGSSGNLDPFVALAGAELDEKVLREAFRAKVDQAIAEGRDPLDVIPELADEFFLIWDDDSGEGYAAAFEFTVPADGDYRLLVIGTPATQTFGDYRLLLGLDAPEVLTGTVKPTGDTIAILDQVTSQVGVAVQEVTGTFAADKRSTFFALEEVKASDTLSVFIEATSGDLAPIVILYDFGNKPLATGNFSGKQPRATLQYTFDDDGRNYRLVISSCCDDGTVTTGDYRLLVGLNAPEVSTGEAVSTDQPILRQPTEVQVGLKMQQITGVDQKAENFGVVASLQMEWYDPALAFSPDSCQCSFKTFTGDDFVKFASASNIKWPEFTLFNQQDRRWSQNQLVVVWSTGRALYFERFSAKLQAPDFDFRRFPFDIQQFFIRIDSLFPEELYVYRELAEFSEVGSQLGEEEWVVTEFDTNISSEIVSTQNVTSRFSFRFQTQRHLNFYIFRIFVPVLVIIVVSWITFFLKDYGKRVDVAGGNLLLFIAFNFTISNDLPRLGYLTLLDTVLISTFVITALVVVFNVYLKRLEVTGKETLAQRIDKYMIWVYPLAYFTAFVLVGLFFY